MLDGSLSLALGDVGVFPSVAVREIRIIVAICSTFGTIFVKQAGDTLTVALSTGPVVALQRVLHRSLLLVLRVLQVFDFHSHLANHQLVLTKDQVLVMSSMLRFGNGVDCTSKVDSSLRIVKVG